MRFVQKLRDAFSRFMVGRYGTDSLNRFLTVVWLFLAIFTSFVPSLILYVVQLMLCAAVFFRMLSRNYVKRQRENATYYKLSTKVKGEFRRLTVRFRQRKTTRFFHCPFCKAPIRMPRKVGKFNVRCPRCQRTFQKEFKH